MFRPNTRGQWLRKLPERSLTGREIFDVARLLPCAIVSLNGATEPTSVRADSSASRGAAEQMVVGAVILVPPAFDVKVGDVVRIRGHAIEVMAVEPRQDVMGKLDHVELRGRMRSEI